MKYNRLSWQKHVVPFLRDPLFLSRWESEYAYDRHDNRITSRVNWGYKTPLGQDDYSGVVFMFLQDLHLKIMPYRHNQSGYSATLANEDPRLTIVLARALGDNEYVTDLSEAVEDFIRGTVQTMFTFTQAYYELAYEKNTEGIITKINLHYVYPPSMIKIYKWYFQIITWKAAKHSRIRAGIRKIPRRNILHVRPPKKFGGKRGVRILLKRLIALNQITPDFHMKAMEENKDVGFDFNAYHDEKYLAKAIVTKKFGWDQRDYRDSNILEYYSIQRRLTEANILAITRLHILNALNDALKSKLEVNNHISIHNLPTEETVRVTEERLRKGDLEFASVIKQIKF